MNAKRNLCGVVVIVVLLGFAAYQVVVFVHADRGRQMRHEAWSVWALAKRAAVEVRQNDGSTRLYVTPSEGRVADRGIPVRCSLTGSFYVWSVPPRTGERIPIEAVEKNEEMFFAHSEEKTTDGRRSFVFPAPVYQRVLSDGQVDWHTQRVLAQ
jgi:hypothetical protein